MGSSFVGVKVICWIAFIATITLLVVPSQGKASATKPSAKPTAEASKAKPKPKSKAKAKAKTTGAEGAEGATDGDSEKAERAKKQETKQETVPLHSVLPFRNNASSLVKDIVEESTFMPTLIETTNVSIVVFYKPGDKKSEALGHVIEVVADKAKGMIPVYGLDLIENEEWALKMMRIEKVPVVTVFPSRITVKKPEDQQPATYTGPHTVDGIMNFALRMIPNMGSVVKNANDFNRVMDTASTLEDDVEMRLARVVLYHNKSDTPPLFKALSVNYHERIVFADVRQNLTVAKENGVTGDMMPAIHLYPKASKKKKIVYEGKMSYQALKEWLAQYAFTDEEIAFFKEDKEEVQKILKTREEMQPNPTVRVATAQEWKENVLDKGGITLLAFLDPTAPQHKDHLLTLQALYRKNRKGGTQVNFAWVDGSKQDKLAGTFDVAGQMPAVVFVNAKKFWHKKFIGSLNERSLSSYMTGQLVKGTGKSFNVADLPEFEDEQLNEEDRKAQELEPNAEEEAEWKAEWKKKRKDVLHKRRKALKAKQPKKRTQKHVEAEEKNKKLEEERRQKREEEEKAREEERNHREQLRKEELESRQRRRKAKSGKAATQSAEVEEEVKKPAKKTETAKTKKATPTPTKAKPGSRRNRDSNDEEDDIPIRVDRKAAAPTKTEEQKKEDEKVEPKVEKKVDEKVQPTPDTPAASSSNAPAERSAETSAPPAPPAPEKKPSRQFSRKIVSKKKDEKKETDDRKEEFKKKQRLKAREEAEESRKREKEDRKAAELADRVASQRQAEQRQAAAEQALIDEAAYEALDGEHILVRDEW